jgi:ABC-type amino acid transport substrate-binding protein
MDFTKKVTLKAALAAVTIIIIAVYIIMISGCGQAADNLPAPEDGQLTIFSNRILVGTDASYPPFEFASDGEIVGFDIDIAREIALRLGRELEIVPIAWDFTYRIPEDIRLDMIISAISESEGKGQFVDFSDPYYTMKYMLIVLSGASLTIREDLKGKNVGMLDNRVKDLDPAYVKDFNIQGYKEVLVMMEDLKSGKIDAVLKSVPVGKNLIEENSGIYRVLETVKSNRSFNMVFHKGSSLRDEVNLILAGMVQDGTYQEIYDRWFLLPAK